MHVGNKNMNKILTEEEAFRAMVIFLKSYYRRGHEADTLLDVLTDVSDSLTDDGSPNDPAQWKDWLSAVQQVRSN